MLKINNMSQVFADIEKWEAEVKALVEEKARNLAYSALLYALDRSAQYSGDFAANWKLKVGSADTSFQTGIFPEQQFPAKSPYIMGDTPAMAHAIAANIGKLSGFKLGETIFLSNSSEHHEQYAWKIENNRIKFRAGNLGSPLEYVVSSIKVNYSTIGKNQLQVGL